VEGLGEDEVKSQAMASWSDRLRSPAWRKQCRSVWLSRPAHSVSDVVCKASTVPYGKSVLSPGVLVGRVLDFEQCRSVWLSANISFSFALTQKKQKVKAVHRS
jgi:hypothetical protein